MNRNAFKVIFNKRLGKMDVVSEITCAEGKSASDSSTTSTSVTNTTTDNPYTRFVLNPLRFMITMTLGATTIVHAQVVADPNASGTQRPTILNTASGATQVNIQTPSAGGVSFNQYKQFDAQTNGTILNNSRTNINTQTAGWVNGNPWLATGSARIIVNQVNSSNPSQLNGSIEVAGPRAEFVISNPAGIQVSGGSFINAARTTLTTGAPIINGGNLEGYRVTQGQISIDGKGLDSSTSDYTDLIARSVKLNAGIWAQNLTVTTGTNQIDAANTVTSPFAVTGNAPSYALDSSALGGMYAGKISFIGTEHGMGINNAGQIAASAGSVAIDANGQLSNSGTISANGQSNVTTIHTTSVHNTGTISAQGNTQVNTANETQNSGMITSGVELQISASDIDNSNGTLNGQRIELNANSLNNSQGKIQQTGTQALALNASNVSNTNGGLIGYEPITSGTGNGGTGGRTGGTGTTTPPSTATGGGSSTVVQPAPVPLTDGAINVTGTVNNDAGEITANGGIDLTSNNGLTNHGQLSLRNLSVKGATLDNSQGTLNVSAQLNASTDTLNNHLGKITAHQAVLNHKTVNNSGGKIQATDTLDLNASGDINNANGDISANHVVSIHSNAIDNNSGSIQSSSSTLNIDASGQLSSVAGTIKSLGNLSLSAQGIDNSIGGILGSGAKLSITAGQSAVNNASGRIIAGTDLSLSSGNLNNNGGEVSSHNMVLTSAAMDNTAGKVIAANTLNATTKAINNDKGLIFAGQTLNLDTQGHGITNTGTRSDLGIVSLENVDIKSGAVNNDGGRISGNKSVTLNSTGAINNASGSIQAMDKLTVQAVSLNNTLGKIGAKNDAQLALTGELNNQGGSVWSETKTLTIKASDIDNSSQGLLSGSTVSLSAANAFNNAAGLVSGGNVTIAAKDLNNQTGTIESTLKTTLNSATVNNTDGYINSNGQIDITTDSTGLAGEVNAVKDINMTASGDYTNTGTIISGGTTHIKAKALTNTKTINGGNVTIDATSLDNQSTGEISSTTKTKLLVAGSIDNKGLIDGGTTQIVAADLHNTGRVYGNHVAIQSNINNDSTGVIASREDMDLAGSTITNQRGGLIHSEGNLSIGGSLDANLLATGQANVVNNLASTIESQGNMTIAANNVNNKNIGLTTKELTTTDNIPEEAYIKFFRALDPAIAAQLFSADNVGRCFQCGDGSDANGNPTLNRLEYVPPSDKYPFEAGFAKHTYEIKVYDATDPVWALFGVTAGDQTTLKNALIDYNIDYMARARNAKPRDIYRIYLNQLQTTQTVIDNAGQAGVISSGKDMTFKGSALLNDNSKIIVGGALFMDGSSLTNNEISGTKVVRGLGTWSGDNVEYDPYRLRIGYFGNGTYNEVLSTETIKLSSGLIQEGLGGFISGSAPSGNNTATGTGGINGNAGNTAAATSESGTTVNGWVNIRSTTGGITIQNNSLYTVNPNNSGYLVATDPKFTSYKSWLSSDFMLSALKLDPSQMHKRLGDGYYEQKLIRDQIAQLTGRHYLSGQTNDDDQYKGLMDAGVTFAGQYKLRPGIALTSEQMLHLTSDIVWLVEEQVTLPDGTQTTALIPKVYVAVKPGDLTGDGALISANAMDLKLTGDLNNSGSISGRKVVKLDANTINNIGGLIDSNQIDAKTQLDFNNVGGTLQAHTSLSIDAGRDVNVTTTTHSASSQSGQSSSQLTQVDRIAGLYVGNGSNGMPDVDGKAINSLSIKAGNNINLNAAEIDNASTHNTQITAKTGDVNIGTVKTGKDLNLIASDINNSKTHDSSDVGTTINGVGHIGISGQNINATAANINSETGSVILNATNDVNIKAGQSESSYESNSYHKDKSFLSSSSNLTHRIDNGKASIASDITGNKVLIGAGHDANISGSHVVSDTLTWVDAKNNVNITTAENTSNSSNFEETKKSGLMGTGGMGFMIGSSKNALDADNTSTTHTGSVIASNGGDVKLTAGKTLNIEGSDVLAANNATLIGQDVNITNSTDTYTQSTEQKAKSSGLTVSLAGTVGDAANGIVGTVNQANAASDRGNDRLAAAYGTKAALTAAQAGQSLYQDFTDTSEANKASQGNFIGLSASIGSSRSQSSSTSTQMVANGSNIAAGNKLIIAATGDGTRSTDGSATNGDVNVIGSNLSGKDVDVSATRDINFASALNTSIENSTNKSSSANLGVSLGVSASGNFGLSIFANAAAGRGKVNGNGTTHTETQVTATDNLSVNAARDLNLTGAQARGNSMDVTVGRDLTITSEQDSNGYKSKQTSANAGVSIPIYGAGSASVNVGVSQQKVNSNYNSVVEQSGLFAGNGGYNVNVKGHTQLNGGVIASTAPAELNSLSTGSLGVMDIENQAQYRASSSGINVGTGSLLSNVVKNLTSALPSSGNQTGNESSTTHAVISDGSITIGGHQATAQELTGISRDTSNAANSLKPIFDLQKVQDNMAMGQVVGEIGQQATSVVGTVIQREAYVARDQAMSIAEGQLTPEQAATYNSEYYKMHPEERAAYLADLTQNKITPEAIDAALINNPEAQKLYDAATSAEAKQGIVDGLTALGSFGALAQANQVFKDAQSNTGAGSKFNMVAQALTGLASGVASGNISQGLSAATQPLLARQIGLYFDGLTKQAEANHQSTTDIEVARGFAHAALGAAVAYASGNDATSGAVGGVMGEAMAAFVKQQMYPGKSNNELTPSERDNIRGIATLAAALTESAVGGSFENAATAASAGYNSAVNNQSITDYRNAESYCLTARTPQSCFLKKYGNPNYVETSWNTIGPAPRADEGTVQYQAAQGVLDGLGMIAAPENLVGSALTRFTMLAKAAKAESALGNTSKASSLLREAEQVCTSGGGLCFTAGTLVLTDKGLQPIETFKGGELVWSRQESGEAYAFKPVTATQVTENQAIYEVVIAGADGQQETISTTAEHPFWTKEVGWLKASWLQAGMELVDAHDQPLMLESVRLTDRVETVYNIEVADYHTYHIGMFGVWVHNDCCYISRAADGSVQYVGITNNFARREAEHLRTKGIDITKLLDNVSRSDAKAVEQVLIEMYGLGKNGGTLLNKINSISTSNPVYAAQLKRGYELLKIVGGF